MPSDRPQTAWPAQLDEARRLDGAARAEALLGLAERRPVLRHAVAPVREVLVEVAGLISDGGGDPLLEARCLLRLGFLALVEGNLDAADAHLERALDRFRAADYFPGVFATTVSAARLLTRRHEREEARALLDQLAVDYARLGESLGPWAGVGLALALGEWLLEGDEPTQAEDQLLAALDALDASGLEDDDSRLAALEGLALVAQARSDGRAAGALHRQALALCQRHGSVEDILRTRLNLGLALVSTNEPGPRGDGHAQLQIVVDGAREHRLEHLRLPALMGLVGVYTNKGATEGALDRVLEIAQSAVEQGKPDLYATAVALMAEVYAAKQEYTQALLALLKGRAALKLTVSEKAARQIDAHIDALAERMGQARFDAMCKNVVAAQEARKRLEATDGK